MNHLKVIFCFIVFFVSSQLQAEPIYIYKSASENHHYLSQNNKTAKFNTAVAKELSKRLDEKFINYKNTDLLENIPPKVQLVFGDVPQKNFVNIVEYGFLPVVFAIHSKNTSIYSVSDLNGKNLGGCMGCIYEKYLDGSLAYSKSQKVRVKKWVRADMMRLYSSTRSAIEDLLVGDGVYLDAVVGPKLSIDEAIQKGKNMKIIDQPVFYAPLAVSARNESNYLAKKVKKLVTLMKEDGTLSKLSKTIIGNDLTNPM